MKYIYFISSWIMPGFYLLIGLLLLGFGFQNSSSWQRYGLGSLLFLYGCWRLFRTIKDGKNVKR